ncbi:MAG: beta-galactosidase trimerization domain-containing protein [Lentisphaeria bacterium]|nr:beta-galactosidase trimerization domain-containing protein [Lentisphaeria bacterium]
MSRIILPIVLWGMAALACAVEFPVKSAAWQGVVETRGAVLKKLSFRGREMLLDRKGSGAFIDAVMGRGGEKTELAENFFDLEFTPVKNTVNSITLSACGKGAFSTIRLTKSYLFHPKRNEFTVTWTLRNIGDTPVSAGVRVKNLFASCADKVTTYRIPRNGKLTSLDFPGGAVKDIWNTAPGLGLLAFHGKSDPAGLLLELPRNLTGTMYFFFSQRTTETTQEFFLNERPIQPGKELSFAIRVLGDDNLPALLARTDPAKYKLVPEGTMLRMPFNFTKAKDTVQVTYIASAKAENHLDFFPKRQINDSWRTAELPEKADPENLSLFQLANDAAEPDRPVPFRVVTDKAGKKLIKFKVPGLRHTWGGNARWAEGMVFTFDRNKIFLGKEDFACRLLFRKGGVIDETIPEGEAELVFNGDFSIPFREGSDIPSGYYACINADRVSKRNNLIPLCPGLKILRRKEPGSISTPIRLERGVKYTFSALASCTNPGGNWIVISAGFMDKNNKVLPKGTAVYLHHSRTSALPMRQLSRSFYPPAGAVSANLFFRVYASDQEMILRKFSLTAEPFKAQVETREAMLRKELKSSFVPGLDLTENLNFSVVTPHWKYYTDPAVKFPKLLYLTGNTGSYIARQVHRRHLLELLQRAKFEFTYLPLLRKIASSVNRWHFNWANELEPYTLSRLENIKTLPEAVLIHNLDFVYVPQVTVDQFHSWQERGVPIIFFNCRGIPKKLLGKEEKLPEHLLATLPRMRRLSPARLRRNLAFYRQGKTPVFVLSSGSFVFWNVTNMPFVPEELSSEVVPNVMGSDFPYWEYYYLFQLKALLYAAGREGWVTARSADKEGLTLSAAHAGEITVRTTVRDYYGRLIGKAEKQFAVKPGTSLVPLPLPADAGSQGTFLVNYKICDKAGRELDCGACKVDPQLLPLEIVMGDPEMIFSRKAPVSFEVKSLPGAKFSCEIVDTDGRRVWQSAGKQTRFSAELKFPYTKLYYLYVRAELDGKTALVKQEFSLKSAPADPHEMWAVIWVSQPQLYPILRKAGFNMIITGFAPVNMKYGILKAVTTNMFEPLSHGSGSVLNRTLKNYTGDVATDPVRDPCFSDPVRAQKVREKIRDFAKSYRFRYYGVRHHSVSDEAFLGGTVCYSPHCLAEFRRELRTRYASLAELNKSWNTSFKTWDEVLPVQLSEIRDKDRLARYVEHTLFMNKVFAKNWVGRTLEYLRENVPETVAGLSGTGNPGLSYDWVQMMKYNPLIMYYGGPQGNAVRDFGPPGGRRGTWLGYARGYLRNEVWAKGRIWQDVFLGANLICKFPCESLLGDLSATPNFDYFAETVRELRAGFGARMLRGEDLGKDVGVLYSQMSVLCAFSNQVGQQNARNTQSSWHALLTDLGLRTRMISYEDLEKNVPKYKVVVLPGAFSLSKNQLANLKKFAEAGGTVVADCGPGWYDDHGNRAADKLAEELFGIDRSKARLYPSDAPQYKTLPLGETGLKLAGAQAALNVSGEPVMITRRHGKGRTVLLNLGIGNYFTVTLGGAGGEEAVSKGGAGVTCQALRELTGPVFYARCKAPFEVKGITGPAIFFHRDGANHYAGVLPQVKDVPSYRDLKWETAQVTFPVKGHLYEMRSGKYLGFGDKCTLKLRSGDPALISILKDKVTGVKITLPAAWKRGESRRIAAAVEGGSGNHVLRFEIRRPGGTLPLLYAWNAYVPAGKGVFDFQFALNDIPGKWELLVRDIDSGVTKTAVIELE